MEQFLSLPDELLVSLLSGWLNLAELTTLDTAFCNRRKRSTLLEIIASNVTQDTELAYALAERFSLKEKRSRINLMMSWLMRRGVGSASVYVTACLAEEAGQLEPFLRMHGAVIAKIHCSSDVDTASDWKQALDLLGKYCPNLQHLTCASNFSTAAYISATQYWPSLPSLTVGSNVTPTDLLVITEGFPRLTRADLGSFLPNLAAAHTLAANHLEQFLVTRGPALTHFTNGAGCTERAYNVFAAHCTQLRVLAVGWEVVSEEVILRIAQNCRLLETLDLRSRTTPTVNVISALTQSGNLTEFAITATRNADEAVAQAIQRNSHLRKLVLDMMDSEASFHAVANHCAGLQELKLFWYGTAVTPITTMHDKLVAIARRCPELRTLSLKEMLVSGVACTVTDDTIAQFALHCPLLTSVCLDGLKDLTDTSITVLAQRCRWLRTLKLAVPGITSVGMLAVATQCSHLRGVYLRNKELVQELQTRKVFPQCVLVSSAYF